MTNITPREYHKVIEYMKGLIAREELKLGDRLPTERALAEQLSVSRNSTREALRILEHMGIIESRQGSGNYLAGNSTRSFADIMEMMLLMKQCTMGEVNEMRRHMELTAFQIAIEHVNVKMCEGMKHILDDMKMAEGKERTVLDVQFHEYIITSASNQLLNGIMDALSTLYVQSVTDGLESTACYGDAYMQEVHGQIYLAFVERDKEKGIRAIHKHYDLLP